MTQLSPKELNEQLDGVGPLLAHTNGNETEMAVLRDLERKGQIDGVMVNGTKASPLVKENGPWRVNNVNGKVVIASDDFTHDVWLSLSGDFGSNEMKVAYAEEVAKALNGYRFSGADNAE